MYGNSLPAPMQQGWYPGQPAKTPYSRVGRGECACISTKRNMLLMHPSLAGQSTMLVQHCSKTKLVPTNVADAVYKSDHLRYIRQHTAVSEGSTTLYSLADIRSGRKITDMQTKEEPNWTYNSSSS